MLGLLAEVGGGGGSASWEKHPVPFRCGVPAALPAPGAADLGARPQLPRGADREGPACPLQPALLRVRLPPGARRGEGAAVGLGRLE